MFDKIFCRKSNILLHSQAPLVNERIKYLQYWAENGAVKATLRRIAQIILSIAEHLNLKDKRLISIANIKEIAENWDKQRRKNGTIIKFAVITKSSYIHHALSWLNSINRLENAINDKIPFSIQLNQFINYMRLEKGLSETTILVRIRFLIHFFSFIEKSIHSLDKL